MRIRGKTTVVQYYDIPRRMSVDVEFIKTPVGHLKKLSGIRVDWERSRRGAHEIDFYISNKLTRKQRLEVLNMLFEGLKKLPTVVRRHTTEIHRFLATSQCNELFWRRD